MSGTFSPHGTHRRETGGRILIINYCGNRAADSGRPFMTVLDIAVIWDSD